VFCVFGVSKNHKLRVFSNLEYSDSPASTILVICGNTSFPHCTAHFSLDNAQAKERTLRHFTRPCEYLHFRRSTTGPLVVRLSIGSQLAIPTDAFIPSLAIDAALRPAFPGA
jgi:hypothetical protein